MLKCRKAKDILLKPIKPGAANDFIRVYHYSHKVVPNSQLHFGVFCEDRLIGVLQFGPSLDKRKIVTLVEGTGWNEFLELNRLAMIDDTPINTESRSLAVAFRLIRRHYPQIKWIVSFADAALSGDGTIYRASGFDLIGIKSNTQTMKFPDSDETITRFVLTNRNDTTRSKLLTRFGLHDDGSASVKPFIDAGFRSVAGFQLKYIYFINKSYRDRLTVPVLPFDEITKRGARMYLGKRLKDSSEPLGLPA